MSPYFDGCYFDPTYFDAAPCAVAAASGGHGRRKPVAVLADLEADEAWLLELIDIPTTTTNGGSR
jgi:hypothetical protein